MVDNLIMSKHITHNPSTNTVTEVTMTAEEIAAVTDSTERNWIKLRLERDSKLAETDWWASSDLTMSDAQKDYRKALRDLPANTSDPKSPTWPSKPS